MTELETSQPVPESDSSTATSTVEEPQALEGAAEPPPEPLTPQRVSEWNAYYDAYVAGAALLLAFVVSCNFVTDSHLWLHLKTGQLIADQMAPVTTDVYSYTQAGRRWVDVPWLFQWGHALLYRLATGLVPDQAANRASAQQIGIGTLVVLTALVRLVTAWVLLRIRHPGPGLWWCAICVAFALGAAYHPFFGTMMGGVAGAAFVAPPTWGQLLMAVELLLLFRAFCLGWGRSLWFLVPIFALWANLDESFLTGLVVLAAASVGYWLDGGSASLFLSPGDEPVGKEDAVAKGEKSVELASSARPIATSTALVMLAICTVACLANPFTYRAFLSAVGPYVQLLQPAGSITAVEYLSYFGPEIRRPEVGGDYWYLFPVYYLVVVALGLGSFLLNVRRFAWSRFLPFAVLALLWGVFMRANTFFGILLASVLALNGQEWYLDRFGIEGRLGRGWRLYSTGGRLATLTLLFLLVAKDITGWGNTIPDLQFGLGYHADDFAFEAAEFLDGHPEIKGNVLNTSMPQGDALIWKTAPRRQTYVDGRARFFPQALLEEWNKMRTSLREDDVKTWKPLLDKYQISTVMIEPGAAPNTLRRLSQSENWYPFYDDGRIVMFGRKDAPASDVTVFKATRLDPDHRAYFANNPVPAAERPPNQTSMLDDIFQNRTASRPQSRTESARRWLEGTPSDDASALSDVLPEPSRCLLAIQEARTALSRSPDDWIAYRRLKDAYRYLMVQETAMLAGIPIVPENRDRMRALQPNLELVMNRFRQRVTALNYAIQTTPPPQSAPARVQLQALNIELFQLYLAANARDLARDRLQAALEHGQPEDYVPERRVELQQVLTQLNQQITQIEEKLADMGIDQASPVELAAYALAQGAAGWAVNQLADAERNNVSPAVVKPQLVDLYCNTGQPDKALDLLSGAVDDVNLGAQPGVAALRQGVVYHLLGNYQSAATLWTERAIPRLRVERSNRVVMAGQAFVRGETIPSVSTLLAVPGSITQQAQWEYDVAMCLLEAGDPPGAAKHFTSALTLAPDLPVRPIAAYYLEKMKKPVPPASKRSAAAARSSPLASPLPVRPGLLGPGTSPLPRPAPAQSQPTGPGAPASSPETKKAGGPEQGAH
jgi:tetratricopeptide (TPR) repeat protein